VLLDDELLLEVVDEALLELADEVLLELVEEALLLVVEEALLDDDEDEPPSMHGPPQRSPRQVTRSS
jgi:hypothetical protein